MKLETFFEKFDLFADAPDAVAKMRELVLQLAVQGRLVSQSSGDEPAGVLGAALAEDRAAFVEKKNLARQRAFAPVEEDQCPFSLPSGWAWTRVGNLCRVQAGFAFESAAFVQGDSGIPMIRIRDITKDRTQVNYVGEFREEFLVDAGDYLVGMDGNFTVAKWRGPRALLNQRVARLQWYSRRLEPSFFAVALQHRLLELQGTKAYTTVDHLSSGQIENAVVPLPPLAEQKRIVAKVDELMALCDRLEAQQQERETRHTALARASLARFAEAPTPTNLNFIFHKSYDITPADLRKSILTLAVQGKLVPQDPNDESAKELLERVASALPDKKSENPFLGAIEPSITDESEYELPPGWIWLPLGHVGIWATGCGFPMQYQGETDGEFLFCKVSDMNLPGNEVEIHTTVHKIDADVMKKIRARANPVGTVIFPKIGGAIATHKRRLVVKPTIIDNNCSGIQPIGLTDDSWLLLFLRNLDLTKYQSGTSVPAVSQGSLDPIRIGLPPLAEQRRIVAKVNELMALVDALEVQLKSSRITAANLLAAAVAELTHT